MGVLVGVEEIDSFAGVIYAGMQDSDPDVFAASSSIPPHPPVTHEADAQNRAGDESVPTNSGIVGDLGRQGQDMVGSAMGMFEGIWSRVIGERGPGLR